MTHTIARSVTALEEWYTPPEVIDVIVEVIGPIGLDPASDSGCRVPAKRHFTAADDGLTRDWIADTVFCNPPYSRGLIDRFVAKFVAEYEAGHFEQGVLLVPSSPDTTWFRELDRFVRCYWRGRIVFIEGATGYRRGRGATGSMLVYAGHEIDRFARVMNTVGTVHWGAVQTRQER